MKGKKVVLSEGMLRTAVKWYHDQLNHPKFTTLSKVMKSNFHIWGLDQTSLKNLYLELQCDICSSNLLLPKRTHSSHIKTFEVFTEFKLILPKLLMVTMKTYFREKGISGY